MINKIFQMLRNVRSLVCTCKCLKLDQSDLFKLIILTSPVGVDNGWIISGLCQGLA